jgi:transposase-like protein
LQGIAGPRRAGLIAPTVLAEPINGEMCYLWRAVDPEGELPESFVTKTRDKAAALRFIRKGMKRHGRTDATVTDGLPSHRPAHKEIGAADRPGDRALVEQPCREFPPRLPATRAGHVAISED